MKLWESVKNNLALKTLSLCLAFLLWLFVSSGRESEISLALPVQTKNAPPGLRVIVTPPRTVNIRLKGPIIQLWKYRMVRPVIVLDLKETGEGTTTFPSPAELVSLPEGVVATRVSPSAVTVTLSRGGAENGGK